MTAAKPKKPRRKPAPKTPRAKAAPKTAAKPKPAAKAPPTKLSVAAATARDIRAIAGPNKALGRGGLAAAALALAREIDDAGTSAAAKASCVRQLRATLDELRQAAARERLEQLREATKHEAPEQKPEPKDGVVDIRNRRKARRARSADS